MKEIFATGARKSKFDTRTISHDTKVVAPILKGGYKYEPEEIEHQHGEGICTAISLTQNAKKALGIKFSADFQYLLQKKYIDGDWEEGSSIFSALKVGKKYGFLPEKEFEKYIVESDRNLPYTEYVKKLKAIPESEIERLIELCSDYKLSGYANVDVDLQSIAKAVTDSKAGVLCRYNVGEEWYTSRDGRISWTEKDINPLRPPKKTITGHAITYARFDFAVNEYGEHANTWGASWNREGLGDIDFSNYKPTEVWIPYYGMTEIELEELKSRLEKQITVIQRLISLYKLLRSLIKK